MYPADNSLSQDIVEVPDELYNEYAKVEELYENMQGKLSKFYKDNFKRLN